MIFPDFFWTNKKSKILSRFQYKHKSKYSLQDTPAHGACSLIDLKFLKEIGGYNEKFDRQDGYYLWCSILLRKYNIMHCGLPLFFYRKHKKNLSNNQKKILETRINIINFFLKSKNQLLVSDLERQKVMVEKKLKKLN